MPSFGLHHVSLPARDIETAAAFYENVLGLSPLERPGFSFAGRWYAVGSQQIHLIEAKDGTFRSAGLTGRDVHFALTCDDFDGVVASLVAQGYSEDLPRDDAKCMRVTRNATAGFHQAFLMDPDGHVIEINAA